LEAVLEDLQLNENPEIINSLPEPAVEPEAPKGRPAWLSFTLEILQTLILALVLYFLIDSVIARVRVVNISMLPTLEPGEFLMVNKLAYRFSDVQRGDIIVFHYPQNPAEDFIKRVIGVPGDTVSVTQGTVYINGQGVDEPYISAPPAYTGQWTIPEDNVFVLGDNRNQSSDSHQWGNVPLQNIVGRALVIYWPFENIKILTHPNLVQAAVP
jgi:signal peptidase I